MSYPNIHAEVTAQQTQIKNKEELFHVGIRNDKEFEEMKKLRLQIKELKSLVNILLQKNDQSHNQ